MFLGKYKYLIYKIKKNTKKNKFLKVCHKMVASKLKFGPEIKYFSLIKELKTQNNSQILFNYKYLFINKNNVVAIASMFAF